MHRLLRIAGSFLIVLVTYWAYALVAVPLIEPSAASRPQGAATYSPRGRRLTDARIDALRPLFPPGAWELENPKILESEQVKLLIRDYRNRGDGRVDIQPCTIIFLPGKPDVDEAQRLRQAVVLQAPEGALLEFDRSFDLRRADIGRLVGGQLKGRITIFSPGSQPGVDDLSIVTRDVQMTESRITTPHAVDFRWGRNYGRGQEMRIKLLPGSRGMRGKAAGPNIAGVELFELQHVERLHLELGQIKPLMAKAPDGATAGGPPGSGPNPAAHGTAGPAVADGRAGAAAPSDLPLEVTCCGPFTFDPVNQVATFESRVDVWRIHPSGPSDQLSGELLSIYFTDRAAAPSGGPARKADDSQKQRGGSPSLTAQRVEARGDPVVLAAPSENLHARGQRLDYNLQTNQIILDGAQEVLLQQGPNEIHGRSLRYQAAGPGRLGQVMAQGPGWLRGQMADRPDQQIEARWVGLLQLRPDEQNQLISLTGGAELKFRGIGQLAAREIHFWMWESPPGDKPAQPRLRPDRMLACEQVRVDSPQFSSTVEQLEVWFEQAAAAGGERWPAGQPANLLLPPREGRGEGPQDRRSTPDHQTHAATPLTLAPSKSDMETTGWRGEASRQDQLPVPSPGARPHFEIVGRLLRARVLLADNQQAELAELLVEDGARFVETQTVQADQQPLLVTGEWLHVVDAAKPYAAVSVTGPQAHFEGRGLALTGPNINLNRGTNRLWIDGPGHMELPLDRDLEGRPLPSPGVLQVHWHDRMEFNGRTAQFETAVTAATPLQMQKLQTETLEVQLHQPIHFADAAIRQDPQIKQIFCRGGVVMENCSFDQQVQTSYDRMEVVDLAVNLQSGALTAGGPGRVNSVRYGADEALPGAGPAAALLSGGRAAAAAATNRQEGQLQCLHIRFQDRITGNLHGRWLTFHDQVRALYGPVHSWQATLTGDDPQALGPRGLVLRCDQLSVNDMGAPQGKRALDVEATGNIRAENTIYTARGLRMTYAEAKDLLTLEGDGRSEAELFRQTQVGGAPSRFAGRRIKYRPKAGTLSVDGAQSLELNQFPQGNRKP
jgi:lipopolysaccharide export system protein LptA